jgi:predicted methyltransferase
MKALWITTASIAVLLAACAESAPAPEDDSAPAESQSAGMSDEADGAMAEPAMSGDALAATLANPRREADMRRDSFRNPGATLEFFDVQPTHTVVEALPGGGWYTRILAPYVAAEGSYMAINYSMAVYEDLFSAMNDETRARLEAWEETFPPQVSEYGGEAAGTFRFGGVPESAAGQADRVLYIRALHNMARTGRLEMAVQDAFTMLKPGGMVGVVQHRAPAEETDARATGARGYLRQADVIAAFEAAGFELVETSEINANPNDAADYEIGVWALPPTNGGDSEGEDVAPLQSVGESDRMTLKFLKPA